MGGELVTPSDKPVVLVVDDHELIATSLEMTLRGEGFNAARARRRGAGGILAEARELAAGAVLLDLDLGRDESGQRVDGVGLVAPLVAAGWHVIVVTGAMDRARSGAALAAGALAVLPKRAPLEHLIAAVRAAFAGNPVMDPGRRQEFIDHFAAQDDVHREVRQKLARLSQREREVLVELAKGQRAQAIADTFVVSLATIRTQIRGILTKLEVGSQLEAVALFRGARRP